MKSKIFYASGILGGIFFAGGFPHKILPTGFIWPFLGLWGLFWGLPPWNFGPLKKRQVLLKFLLFALSYALTGFYWIPYTVKEFGDIGVPYNYFLGPLFSLISAPQLGLFCLASYFFINKKKSWNWHHPLALLALAALAVLSDQFFPQQFPTSVGHSWLNLAPYLGLGPYIGEAGHSLVSYWLVFSLLTWWTQKRPAYPAISVFSLVLLMNFLMPLEKFKAQPDGLSTKLRLVQANIGNFMKIQSEKGNLNVYNEVRKRYFQLSTRMTDGPLDLIVWPETAYPEYLHEQAIKKSHKAVPFLFKRTMMVMKTPLFTGGYTRAPKSNFSTFKNLYNSTFLFNPETNLLEQLYHKQILIPFGEGLPFGPFNEALSKVITNVSYFAEGEEYSLFKLKNGAQFISAICYEVLFSRFIRSYLNSVASNPHFLINVTNDSWYGDTSEPFQHLFLAHWRAIEFGLPIVRMTNTGITSVLYPDGSESKRIPSFVQDHLDINLHTPKNPQKTFFQSWGLFSLLLLLILAAGISLIFPGGREPLSEKIVES